MLVVSVARVIGSVPFTLGVNGTVPFISDESLEGKWYCTVYSRESIFYCDCLLMYLEAC